MEYKYNFEEDLGQCIARAKILREKLRYLDLENPNDLDLYLRYFAKHASELEGVKSESYVDKKGFRTLGIGFLMDNKRTKLRSNSQRKKWNEAFKNYPDKPDFDAVYEERELLDDNQIQALFNHSLSEHRSDAIREYKDLLKRLSPKVMKKKQSTT